MNPLIKIPAYMFSETAGHFQVSCFNSRCYAKFCRYCQMLSMPNFNPQYCMWFLSHYPTPPPLNPQLFLKPETRGESKITGVFTIIASDLSKQFHLYPKFFCYPNPSTKLLVLVFGQCSSHCCDISKTYGHASI